MILLQYMYKQSIFNTKHCALQTNDLQINRKKELYHERKHEVKRAGWTMRPFCHPQRRVFNFYEL